MKNIIGIFILMMLSHIVVSQKVRPTGTVGSIVSTGGSSPCGCSINDTGDAWDSSTSTFTTFDMSNSILGDYGEVTYEFSNAIDYGEKMEFVFAFEGNGVLYSAGAGNIVSSEVFEHIRIELLDNSGNSLEVYDHSNMAIVSVISYFYDYFKIIVYNPDASTRRVKVRAGSLTDQINRDVYLFDINFEPQYPIYATRSIGNGSAGSALITLCGNCFVYNADLATDSYAPNTAYSSMEMGVFVGVLSTDYLYINYDWDGSSYSGTDYDIQFVLQTQNTIFTNYDMGTSFFNTGQLGLSVRYSDGTSEFFNSFTGGVSVTSFEGSGLFQVTVDANDSKSISSIGVRLYGGLLAATRRVNTFNVHLTPANIVLPITLANFEVENHSGEMAKLKWQTALEINNRGFYVQHSSDGENFREVGFVEGVGDTKELQRYEFVHQEPASGVNYYRLRQVDRNGDESLSPVVSFRKIFQEGMCFYNQSQKLLTFEIANSERKRVNVQIFDLNGRKVKTQSVLAENSLNSIDVRDLSDGHYIVTLESDDMSIRERFFKR